MSSKRIFKKHGIRQTIKSGTGSEMEVASTSSCEIPEMSFFKVADNDSPSPQEPFDDDRLLPVEYQLLYLLRKNYDIMSLITEIERERLDTRSGDQNNNWKSSNHLAPLPNQRYRAQSIAVPTISVREPCLSPDSSRTSMEDISTSPEKTLSQNMRSRCIDFYKQVADAVNETNDDLKTQKSSELQKLSPHALKRDIKRCLTQLQPYIETANGLRDLFIWKNPVASLCTFFVYFYSVYRGWTVSLFFFVILFQLTINYVATQKKINIGLNFLPRKEVTFNKMDYSGAQLVFDVARKVQILLTFLADIFEKIKNLFIWKKPEVTSKFFILVSVFFLISISFSNSTCLTLVGFGLGGKAFITTYLFHRFPKLRSLFDVIFYFYEHLPTSRTTEIEIQNVQKKSACSLDSARGSWKSSNDPLPKSQSTSNILSPEIDMRRRSIGVISYEAASSDCALTSSSPITQKSPVKGNLEDNISDETSSSEDGPSNDMFMITRSCVLIDKEKPFPWGMTSGTLMLNDKVLAFRYQKIKNGYRNILQIPFPDIASVKKIRTLRTFSLMPGSSKGLEIRLSTKKKPIQFVGIPKRDEFYEALIETSRIAGIELILNDDETL